MAPTVVKSKTKPPNVVKEESQEEKTKSQKVAQTQAIVEGKENLTPNNQADSLPSTLSAPKHRTLRTTDSKRAGLIFPVARTVGKLRKGKLIAKHIQKGAGVYMAAVLEYCCAEVLDIAGDVAAQKKRARITPRHITLAIANDGDLEELFKNSVIAGGGKAPFIHKKLLKMKTKPKKKKSAFAQVDLDDVDKNKMEM